MSEEKWKSWMGLIRTGKRLIPNSEKDDAAGWFWADAELSRLREAVAWALAEMVKAGIGTSYLYAELHRRAKEGKDE